MASGVNKVIAVPGTIPPPIARCSTNIAIYYHRRRKNRPGHFQVCRWWTREYTRDGTPLRSSVSLGSLLTAQEAWDLAKKHGPARITVPDRTITGWLKRHKVKP